MSSLIRLVLEENNTDNTVTTETDMITLTGPLASNYTEALNIALDKKQPLEMTDGISQESFSMQQSQMASVSSLLDPNAVNSDFSTSKVTTHVYGVGAAGLDDSEVKNISGFLANGEANPNDHYVVVLDTSVPEIKDGQPDVYPEGKFIGAIECLVEAYGAKKFNNFVSFANTVKKR